MRGWREGRHKEGETEGTSIDVFIGKAEGREGLKVKEKKKWNTGGIIYT